MRDGDNDGKEKAVSTCINYTCGVYSVQYNTTVPVVEVQMYNVVGLTIKTIRTRFEMLPP